MRRKVHLETGKTYHIYNRGLNNSKIFPEDVDYARFYLAALHYKSETNKFSYERRLKSHPQKISQSPNPPKVEVYAYSLLPDHFHFIVKQLEDGGISYFISNLSNSYVRYLNTKVQRSGPLFQGPFKNALVAQPVELTNLARYIHLKPLLLNLTTELKSYEMSSYLSYLGRSDELINKNEVMQNFTDLGSFEMFMQNREEYGREFEKIKHLTFEKNPAEKII